MNPRNPWPVLAFLLLGGCSRISANTPFFGKTDPPAAQVLRYVTGPEPESLDPLISSGQPESRIYMALYEGLEEYAPKTGQPIPALAESWEANADLSEFTFHLRKNARFSNGDPIKAQDFVWSLRRGLTPALASRIANMAYPVLYAQAFNEGSAFLRDAKTGQFDLEAGSSIRKVVPADSKVPAGKEFVPVKAEDVGISALDDVTLRYKLTQPTPYFVGLLCHQFFRVVHRATIEKYGDANWTQPQNIVTSGPFRLKEWTPYDKLVVVRDPMYWDAASVKLDEIRFYPLEELPSIMNLYKAGEIDAMENHAVPTAWLESIMPMKDYMGAPEMYTEYIQINTEKAPMNDVRVRHAFTMAVDLKAIARFKHTAIASSSFVPLGVFPGYPVVPGNEFNPERAKQYLVEAGYRDANGNYDPSKFPIEKVTYTYNTNDRNRQTAEFLQSQWKQNLGLTVPLKNMEFKTFLDVRAKREYEGFARGGWIGDYLDPFSYLNIFITINGDNGTGWWDQKYVDILNAANRLADPQKRFAKLAEAEKMLLDANPVLPLFVASTDWMKKPYVKGMYPNPGTAHPWKFVYIEHDPSKWDYGVPSMKD